MRFRSYRSSKLIKDWRAFRKTIKMTKRTFFNKEIQEITSKHQ